MIVSLVKQIIRERLGKGEALYQVERSVNGNQPHKVISNHKELVAYLHWVEATKSVTTTTNRYRLHSLVEITLENMNNLEY
jgi:cytochrome c